jgi:hypothetical protein
VAFAWRSSASPISAPWRFSAGARLFARALSDSQGGDGGALYVRTRWLDDGGEIYELNPEAPLYNKAMSDGMNAENHHRPWQARTGSSGRVEIRRGFPRESGWNFDEPPLLVTKPPWGLGSARSRPAIHTPPRGYVRATEGLTQLLGNGSHGGAPFRSEPGQERTHGPVRTTQGSPKRGADPETTAPDIARVDLIADRPLASNAPALIQS